MGWCGCPAQLGGHPEGSFLDLTQKFVNPESISRDDRRFLVGFSHGWSENAWPAPRSPSTSAHRSDLLADFVCSRATTKATARAARDGSRGSAATRSSSDEERQAQGAADEERVEEFLRLLLFAQRFGSSRSEGAAASSRVVGVKKVQVCLNTQCSKCCCSYELLACASSSLSL